MEKYLPYLFAFNIVLIFIDATIGYHAAPTLAQLADGDETGADEPVVRDVRTLLAAVVALCMLFNCLAFFNTRPSFLLLVSGVLALDIVAQVTLRIRINNRKEQ